MRLTLRNVDVAGRSGLDVRIDSGRIAEIGQRLPRGGDEIDGRGGAVIPGLCDHHIHLLALAAQADSVTLEGVASAAQLAARIADALATRPAGAWVRVTGYHETMAGDLSCADLDRLAPRHRLRVQHQTGSLWMLNAAALEAVATNDMPDCVERDAEGRPTGRIWRGDAWLRSRIGVQPPALASIGRQLASYGITALTDASVTTNAEAAALLADGVRSGDLPQRLTLMSGGVLEAPADGAFDVGPLKVLLDEHDLPELDDFIERITCARAWGRAVAVHCVTAAELAITLAAFHAADARPGDRIEHGGVIPDAAIAQLRTLGLTVVTQPGFVLERGDRYLAQVEADARPDLYRCASLLHAGVPVAASSDAPYASPDPWLGVRAAAQRRTRGGQTLGEAERISPSAALALYLDDPAAPGRVARGVTVGAPADLCLLKAPLKDVLAEPSAEQVAATLVSGSVTYLADPR